MKRKNLSGIHTDKDIVRTAWQHAEYNRNVVPQNLQNFEVTYDPSSPRPKR